MHMRSVKEADVSNKRVVVRVDFNVPLKAGKVADDKRIQAALPTIRLLQKKKAKIVLISHLGRPKGKVVEALRLKPVAERLSKLLKNQVQYVQQTIGSEVEDCVYALEPGEVLLLENVRFHKEEEKDDRGFAQKLASLGDVYVNDAFGTCHRAHASVHAITKFLPSYAGLLLEKEVKALSLLVKNPKRPFIAVIGGIKVDDKLGMLKQLLKRVDAVLLGSAMAARCYAALGKSNEVATLLKKAKGKLMLPVDVVTASSENAKAGKVRSVHERTKEKWLDIGPETCRVYAEIIGRAKTVFWNGPMGLAERRPFEKGTRAVAKAMAACKGKTIVGGGDTVAMVEKCNVQDKFTHVSTGGGAALKFVEGKKLPGLVALK